MPLLDYGSNFYSFLLLERGSIIGKQFMMIIVMIDLWWDCCVRLSSQTCDESLNNNKELYFANEFILSFFILPRSNRKIIPSFDRSVQLLISAGRDAAIFNIGSRFFVPFIRPEARSSTAALFSSGRFHYRKICLLKVTRLVRWRVPVLLAASARGAKERNK